MSGRFRFTPACCCGGEEPGPEPDCIFPCVPGCAEFFAGVDSTLTDRFVTISRNDFLPECGDAAPFTVSETPDAPDGDPYHATISSVHVEGGNWIQTRIAFCLQYAEPASVFAETTNPGTYFAPPVRHAVNVLISSYLANQPVGTIPLEEISYDSPVVHHVSPNADYHVYSFRLFCRPFDLESQPFRFCDGATSVGLAAAPYLSLSDCGFSYATECNEEGLLTSTYRTVFNASLFQGYSNALVFTVNVLDYYVVRLFGFTSPLCTTKIGTADYADDFLVCDVAGLSVEFVITSLKNISDYPERIVCGTMCVRNFPDESQPIDWSSITLPPGLEDYADWTEWAFHGPAWTQKAYTEVKKLNTGQYQTSSSPAYPLISFVAHSHVPCSFKFGDISNMPTVWRSPVKAVTAAQDTNANRFHGIYWIKAAISPCGEEFPQDVTHGILWSVPIGLFRLSGAPQNAETSIGGQPLAYFSSTLSKAMSSFVNADWDKTWTDSLTQNSGSLKYDIVPNSPGTSRPVHWTGSNLVDSYIPKPSGKHLTQLYWRVLKRMPYYPVNKPHAGSAVNLRGNATTDGDTIGFRNNLYYGLYDTTNLDLYEVSVNGSGFKTFTDSDTGATCYVPAIGAGHIMSYIGTTEPKIYALIMDANRLYNSTDVKIYPRLDLGYIAVWENDS